MGEDNRMVQSVCQQDFGLGDRQTTLTNVEALYGAYSEMEENPARLARVKLTLPKLRGFRSTCEMTSSFRYWVRLELLPHSAVHSQTSTIKIWHDHTRERLPIEERPKKREGLYVVKKVCKQRKSSHWRHSFAHRFWIAPIPIHTCSDRARKGIKLVGLLKFKLSVSSFWRMAIPHYARWF